MGVDICEEISIPISAIAVFEFSDTAVRDALNHIQKEEQEHGDKIYKYMAQNGMY